MVARDVVDLCAFLRHGDEALDHFKMAFREVGFLEVPNVNDVAVEDQDVGLYRFEVGEKLAGMASEGSEVKVA